MKKLSKITMLLLCAIICLTGCKKSIVIVDSMPKVYYFDTFKNQLVVQNLPEEFTKLDDEQQKLQYIIQMLVSASNEQDKQSSIVRKPVPIESAINNSNDKNIKIYLKEEYANLTSNEQIGVRGAVVYSLTQLDSIDSITFYVDNQPLTASNGKIIGPVTRSNIKLSALAPNPVITQYTLPLYFVNEKGELIKEERGISVSDPASIEKSLIEELIKGPNSGQLQPSLPSNMKVNEAVTVNGVCQVDLSLDLKSKFFTSTEVKERMLYAIVNSLTEIIDVSTNAQKIKKVAFLINGKSDIEFTPNIQLRNTFERNEDYIGE